MFRKKLPIYEKLEALHTTPIETTWSRLRCAAKDLLVEFCSTSTIHGVGHIGGGQGRSCWGRFWWVVMLVVAFLSCGALIDNLYSKWQDKPVILTFDERPTTVQEIPFPAVTICPEAQYRMEEVNISEKIIQGNVSREEAEKFLVASEFSECDLKYLNYQVNRRGFTLPQSLLEVLKKIYLGDPHKVIKGCLMNGYSKNLFMETITDMGICYTFNLLPEGEIFRRQNIRNDFNWNRNASNWIIDGGYQQSTFLYPIVTVGSGLQAGLQIEVQVLLENTENLCGPTQGFYLMLHSPAEYPLMMRNYVFLQYGQKVGLAIRPDIVSTSAELRETSPLKRQCFFSDERTLRYFVNYTQANCEMECYTNFTRERCKCVQYFMPQDGDDVSICEKRKYSCSRFRNFMSRAKDRAKCNCLPGCNSIEYSADSISVPFSVQAFAESASAVANIYYTQNQYMGLKRDRLFGWTEFIANCGGVLGLCMGISLLSLAELVYYGLIRPMIAIVQVRREPFPVFEFVH